VAAVLVELRCGLGDGVAVRREQHARVEALEPVERGEVVGHVALVGIDDHRAHARHQIAGQDIARCLLDEDMVAVGCGRA